MSIFCKTKLGLKEYISFRIWKFKITFHYTSLFLLFVLWLATLPTAPGSPEKKKTYLFVTAQRRVIVYSESNSDGNRDKVPFREQVKNT